MEYKVLSSLYYQNRSEYNILSLQRKESEFAIKLPFLIGGNTAFFCMCQEIYDTTCQIMKIDKDILPLRERLPTAALDQFTKKCLIDEMKLTNDIEGVFSTRKELSEALNSLSQKSGHKSRFYGLAQKYSMLSREYIPLKSCIDVRRLYDELVLAEILEEHPENRPDGTIFRKEMNEVTTKTGKVIHRGAYPEKQIIELMENALAVLNDSSLPVLIRISLFHYLFGYIHPFYDGNGRTSRFISSYLLAQEFDHLIGYGLSYTIKENKKAYYNAFEICNDKRNCGDLTPFIITFLNIVYVSFVNLFQALDKRKTALEQNMDILKKLNLFSDRDNMLDFCYVLMQSALFSSDGIPQKELCTVFNLSTSTIAKRLSEVEKAGILKKHRDGHSFLYSIDLPNLSSLAEQQ